MRYIFCYMLHTINTWLYAHTYDVLRDITTVPFFMGWCVFAIAYFFVFWHVFFG